MADNETSGSGKAIATDKVTFSGDADQNVQLIRPVHVIGAEGSKTVVDLVRAEDTGHTTADPGIPNLLVRNDANADLVGTDLDYVMGSSDAKGNQNVLVRRGLVRIPVTSAGLTTGATAYAAGDQVGTIFTFAGAARASGGGGTITSIVLTAANDTIGAMDLAIFRQSVTLAADNAAHSISVTDILFLEAYVNLSGSYDLGASRMCVAHNLAIPYTCAATSLFGALITRAAIAGTPFGATTNIQINLYVELN